MNCERLVHIHKMNKSSYSETLGLQLRIDAAHHTIILYEQELINCFQRRRNK
jgi:hypothetical protein